MKLFYAPGACSLSPHIILRETGLKFELEKVDIRAHKTEKGTDYYSINPKGYVPALQLDNGQVLTEGPAIVQYLADQKPEAKLAPAAGTLERYRLQEWLTFIGTEIHKQYSPLFNPATPEDAKKLAIEKIGKRLELIAQSLAGKQFLVGDQLTGADTYLFVMLNWSRRMGPDIDQWPALKSFFERLSARPTVKAALEAEGLNRQ